MHDVLVTGGAGFIGSHLVDFLIAKEYKVHVVDNLSHGSIDNINKKAIFHPMDIRSKDLISFMQSNKFDYVFHLAAQVDVQKSVDEPIDDASINILGTLNVLQGCRLSKVKKIIYSSSAAIYGVPAALPIDESHEIKPCSGYGASKVVPELYMEIYQQLYGLEYTVLRYSNVYGPRQDSSGEGGVVAIFLDKLLRGESPTIYGDGGQTRDFIFVDDVCAANILAMTLANNKTINISSSKQVTINQLFETCSCICGRREKPVYQDAKPGDIYHSYLNNSTAREFLKWIPETDLVQGLRKTIFAINQIQQ